MSPLRLIAMPYGPIGHVPSQRSTVFSILLNDFCIEILDIISKRGANSALINKQRDLTPLPFYLSRLSNPESLFFSIQTYDFGVAICIIPGYQKMLMTSNGKYSTIYYRSFKMIKAFT